VRASILSGLPSACSGRAPGEAAHEFAGNAEGLLVSGDEAIEGGSGEAEIKDVGFAAFIDADVAGLEIAMNDALLVGGVHGIADFEEHAQQLAGIVGVFLLATEHVLPQIHARDVVHDDIAAAISGAAGIDDRDDVGVIQRGQDVHFAIKARELAIIGEGSIAQYLHGNFAARTELSGDVDDALAAAIEFAEDGVARDPGNVGRLDGLISVGFDRGGLAGGFDPAELFQFLAEFGHQLEMGLDDVVIGDVAAGGAGGAHVIDEACDRGGA